MTDLRNPVVVTVSGRDRPGITAAFARVLVRHGVEVVDIDQAALQDLLALTFLIDLDGDADTDRVLKDLLFEAHRLGMSLQFQPLSEREVRRRRDRNLFVITFFGGTRALAEISGILGAERANIVKIVTLGRHAERGTELTVNVHEVESVSELKHRLVAVSHDLGVDLAMQKLEAYRKGKRLVFFDMDQTLLDMEVIDEMARAAGCYEAVARVTEKAMRGDLDFEDSLRQRVAFLKGLGLEQLERIRDSLRLSEGARALVATLRRLGYRVGVVSGGFQFFADHLAETLGLDFAYANRLEIRDGVLTGRVVGDVIDGAAKARLVHDVAARSGVMLDQTVAIGDGSNDRLMLGQAGLGIAYNARRSLVRAANASLGRARLIRILYLLGITEDDIATVEDEGRANPGTGGKT